MLPGLTGQKYVKCAPAGSHFLLTQDHLASSQLRSWKDIVSLPAALKSHCTSEGWLRLLPVFQWPVPHLHCNAIVQAAVEGGKPENHLLLGLACGNRRYAHLCLTARPKQPSVQTRQETASLLGQIFSRCKKSASVSVELFWFTSAEGMSHKPISDFITSSTNSG